MIVTLAGGTVRALQLDDAGTCRRLDIAWDYTGGGRITVVGSREAMVALARYADEQRQQTDPRSARSAGAALQRIADALLTTTRE